MLRLWSTETENKLFPVEMSGLMAWLIARLIQVFLVISILRFHFVVDANLAESKEFMSGKVLRVAIFHVSFFLQLVNWLLNHFKLNYFKYPPSINITKLPNATFTYSGSAMDIIEYVAKGLDIS